MTRVIVVAAVLSAVVLSCAGPSKSVYVESDEKKNEILALWQDIREMRRDAGLAGVEPPSALIRSVQHVSVDQVTAMCQLPAEPKGECNDICGIAEHICENAEAICRIADELRRDQWADEKCASAKASCKEAKENCCKCEADHSGEDGEASE